MFISWFCKEKGITCSGEHYALTSVTEARVAWNVFLHQNQTFWKIWTWLSPFNTHFIWIGDLLSVFGSHAALIRRTQNVLLPGVAQHLLRIYEMTVQLSACGTPHLTIPCSLLLIPCLCKQSLTEATSIFRMTLYVLISGRTVPLIPDTMIE